MKLNPFLNASLAGLYIIGIVFCIQKLVSLDRLQDTPLIPMTMLSLFVLSAAVMGFLFVYEPLRLYFDGSKKEAVRFFLMTVACFACFALLVLSLLIYVGTR